MPKPATYRIDPFTGKLALGFGVPDGPDAADYTTWWSNGPQPGSVGLHGMAAILGHTEIGGELGVFQNLPTLPIGSLIQLASVHHAATLTYRVFFVNNKLDKNTPEDLHDAIADPPAVCAHTSCIVLVTCSGTVVKLPGGGYSHDHNTAAYARLT